MGGRAADGSNAGQAGATGGELTRRGFMRATGATLAAATAGKAIAGSNDPPMHTSDPQGGATRGGQDAGQAGHGAGGARPRPPFGDALPYPSQRAPVLARNCVATSQPLAAQAGLEMLRLGGNAADAAVATAAALTVVEPTANGIGADAFALIHAPDGSGGHTLHGLNASGRAPRALDRADYEGLDDVPLYDWRAVTTPGAVSGWAAAHERFGRLPFETVLGPAIRYAEGGYPVSPGVAASWARASRFYRGHERFDAWRATFLPDGKPPATGQVVRLAGHARTLTRIAETKGRAFYGGIIAEAIDAESRRFGGSLRLADLTAHEAQWVDPIDLGYRGWRVHEIPPNGQGITALIALGILEHFELGSMEVDSARWLHLQIEAMKLAFADARRHVADPEHMTVSPADLLAPDALAERASRIDPRRAQDFFPHTPKPGGTVLLTAADADGMLVSFIQSNYTGFGSGMVVPGFGVALQNRGGNFTLERGHPNELAPGKRPYHTIIPGMVTAPWGAMAFGVMGGFMQPQGHAQVVVRMADHEQNPQAALDAPRWQVEAGGRVLIEPGFADAVYDDLAAMGHTLARRRTRSAAFGRGQAIVTLGEGAYMAASDLRADGQAVGF